MPTCILTNRSTNYCDRSCVRRCTFGVQVKWWKWPMARRQKSLRDVRAPSLGGLCVLGGLRTGTATSRRRLFGPCSSPQIGTVRFVLVGDTMRLSLPRPKSQVLSFLLELRFACCISKLVSMRLSLLVCSHAPCSGPVACCCHSCESVSTDVVDVAYTATNPLSFLDLRTL